jgi:hypothetical protein
MVSRSSRIRSARSHASSCLHLGPSTTSSRWTGQNIFPLPKGTIGMGKDRHPSSSSPRSLGSNGTLLQTGQRQTLKTSRISHFCTIRDSIRRVDRNNRIVSIPSFNCTTKLMNTERGTCYYILCGIPHNSSALELHYTFIASTPQSQPTITMNHQQRCR